MDLNRKPSTIASAAAEEIRALNHASLDRKAFENPADVSDTANALLQLLERLPQALSQLEAGLLELSDNQRIRLDDKPPAETSRKDISDQVFAVVWALGQTRDRLGQAHTELREATGPLSHMGSPWEVNED